MIGRGQCFVRAKDPEGRWHTADVLDLDDESWRIFILSVIVEQRSLMLVTSDDPPPELRSTTLRKD